MARAAVPRNGQPRSEASVKVVHAPDKRSARALVVMLVAIGLLIAYAIQISRGNSLELAAAERQRAQVVQQNERLQVTVDELVAQGQADSERLNALQLFIAQILARSDDPVLREVAGDVIGPTATPSTPARPPAPARTAQPSPTSRPQAAPPATPPTPAPRPSQPAPQPSPSPSDPGPLSEAVEGVCTVLLDLC